MNYPRLVIAGTASGVGKTTVTLAILAALRQRGRQVQAFKAGPDFIDPRPSYGRHRSAVSEPGWLDVGGGPSIETLFARAAADADISIIEGMMGLFDGSSPINEIGSTAEIAKQLDAPVLLVIDGSAMARSAAAMVSGYAQFDPALTGSGCLVQSSQQRGALPAAQGGGRASTPNVVVVGYLRPDPAVTISDRHLGLVTGYGAGHRRHSMVDWRRPRQTPSIWIESNPWPARAE